MNTRSSVGLLFLTWLALLQLAENMAGLAQAQAQAQAQATAQAAAPAKWSKEQLAQAEKAVQDYLVRIEGDTRVRITRLDLDAPVVRKLADPLLYFSVLYPQFPVGRIPPKGLKVANLFLVGKDNKPLVLTDVPGLQKLFHDSYRFDSEKAQKEAAHFWLTVSAELEQDGYYKFKILESDTTVSLEDKNRVVTVKGMVSAGGNGTLQARLTFNPLGQLIEVKQDVSLVVGPRPRCQATKLLDVDPLVRTMAEQNLLYLGSLARDYLFEQRAKASPELQRAIDRIWWQIQLQERHERAVQEPK